MFTELLNTLKIVFVLKIVLVVGLSIGYLGGVTKERKDFCRVLENRWAEEFFIDFVDFGLCDYTVTEEPDFASYSIR